MSWNYISIIYPLVGKTKRYVFEQFLVLDMDLDKYRE